MEIDKIDPRTNLRILRTEYEQLAKVNNNPLLVKAQAIGDQKFLKIKYYTYNNFLIKEEPGIEFILIDNDRVTLKPYNPGNSDNDKYAGLTVSTLIIFELSDSDFKKLSNSDIATLKFYIDAGYINKSIKKKRTNAVRIVLNCLK